MPAPRPHRNVAERESATRSRHIARCAKAPVGSPAGALLYLMPRSLGAACFCSPSVTQCEPQRRHYDLQGAARASDSSTQFVLGLRCWLRPTDPDSIEP
jgi:hypothetical protein